MNNNSNFVRKIVYIVVIGALLIPLSLVSRPATRGADGSVSDSGGELAQLRDEYELSQSQLMEIDPASETMKLASLGLRGVAVNLLWMQAIEHKKKENFDQLASTLRALTKIQPNFVKVWEYQGHNMAYNISMEFDDYEYRYHWVKKGISFLKEGIPYNRSDHRMKENLGFFTGMKLGRSDEKDQFRRMFREDDVFHQSMADYIEPDLYDTREYGHDNWKMAYHWYDLAIKMVEDESFDQYTSDTRFYMHRPAQLRNQGLSLGKEFRTDEIIRDVWTAAADEWEEYGRRELRTASAVITMEGMLEYQLEQNRLESELDALAPEGLREELMKEVRERVNLTPTEELIINTPPDQLDEEQFMLGVQAQRKLAVAGQDVNLRVLEAVDERNAREAKRIFDRIMDVKLRIGAVGNNDSVNNYRYWRILNRAESTEQMAVARQSLYDAREMARQSIFDDEYEFNYETKEKKIVRLGAISRYMEAFEAFAGIFEEHPTLRSGGLSDDVMDELKQYKRILDLAGQDWPENFPLQEFIDFKAQLEGPEGIPTSEELEEIRSGRGESKPASTSDSEEDSASDGSAAEQEQGENAGTESDDQAKAGSEESGGAESNAEKSGSEASGETESSSEKSGGESGSGESGSGESGSGESGSGESGSGESGSGESGSGFSTSL